ncbi:MAG: 4-(cytidine 5'-diphospho)-2-C-methyl-D-erythritol kinase [Acidobacteria bacterium]|nr:4-(cytidine 5'-diphospho)-2-C-methyl-D-erythritol kinase [Acidobacteriota bacterium]
MTVSIRSFGKINLGLSIGALRPDGFHELRTIYQTIAIADTIRVSLTRGAGIEIRCCDPRVPKDSTNTCFRIVERAMESLGARGRVVIEIEKSLPVQGGLGGASANAVAALLATERTLHKQLASVERFRIAAEVGSDLPLFLVGGTVLGLGRGEEVFPLPDLPAIPCVLTLPEIRISTPEAFAAWDALDAATTGERRTGAQAKLTARDRSAKILEFNREISAWLSERPFGRQRSGVSARSGGRAENPLLDLVRTGIENDFERVVFPQHPEMREVKRVLKAAGAFYASLSGSGSALYGLFDSREKARLAVSRLRGRGLRAVLTSTLSRRRYWNELSAAHV